MSGDAYNRGWVSTAVKLGVATAVVLVVGFLSLQAVNAAGPRPVFQMLEVPRFDGHLI